MRYVDACQILFSLPRFDLQGAGAISPGLDNIRALLHALGDPHRRYPIVHVAGTNGKGSVCSMLASILTSAGLKTGLHTSPHLISFAERMRVDGREADEAWIAEAVSRMQASVERVRPSFFEASTALALLYFAECEVDIAIIEVGMGGRLDATNIVEPQLCVITNIGRDHTLQLGDTLPLIAREKAGIIKRGVPVVTGACQPEVLEVIETVALERSAPLISVCREPWSAEWDNSRLRLTTPDRKYPSFRLDLPGQHQSRNALVAAACASQLLPGPNVERAVVRGLSNIRRLSGLRGRCEIIQRDPLVIVDVCHNEDGIRAALNCLEREDPDGNPAYVMLGLAADKDVRAILGALREHSCTVMPTAIPGNRGLPPSDLALAAGNLGLRIVEIRSPKHGWEWFKEQAVGRDRLLIAGSHYLVGSLPEEIFPQRAVLPA